MAKRRRSKRNGALSLLFRLILLALFLAAFSYIFKTCTFERVVSPIKEESSSLTEEKENTPLYFGNPSAAAKTSFDNYLLEKTTYALSYNASKMIPLWCAWHLNAKDLGSVGRSGEFSADTSLPSRIIAVDAKDYQYKKYGFDRGHLCPSADRTSSIDSNRETFLMTNMLPQSAALNRNVWKKLEVYSRNLAKRGKELYIIAGGTGEGGESEKGTFSVIQSRNKKISVPAFCYKIILILDEGDDDMKRVNKLTPVICVLIPNKNTLENDWSYYTLPVDNVEELTKLDFLSLIPDETEDVIEAKTFVK